PVVDFYRECGPAGDYQHPIRILVGRVYLHKSPLRGEAETVFAVPRLLWKEGLSGYLDRVTFIDRRSRLLVNAIRQKFTIRDYLYMQNHPAADLKDVPTVPLHLMGLDGTKGVYHWKGDALEALNITLTKGPPLKSTLRLAKGLLGRHADPYKLVR